ncbi:MAG: hypothetical protein WA775_02865 [Psychroserpens sp.]|uniref:hypothetical protein n=1 Tax=Psychroserpens sp. TaxID=2020870 RepID=UPI003CC042FF
MKTQARIIKLLKFTPDQYENLMLNTYFTWCSNRTANKRTLQKHLTSPALFNWWKAEMSKLEREFLEGLVELPLKDPTAYRRAYKFSTGKIFNRFSKPLIQKANEGLNIINEN